MAAAHWGATLHSKLTFLSNLKTESVCLKIHLVGSCHAQGEGGHRPQQ